MYEHNDDITEMLSLLRRARGVIDDLAYGPGQTLSKENRRTARLHLLCSEGQRRVGGCGRSDQRSPTVTPKQIICQHHYTKSWPSGKSVVFTYEDAIVVFSIPANYMVSRWLGCEPNRVWELTRLWAPDGHRKNLLTQAISYAVVQFRKLGVADALVSYADINVGHKGGVYRAASWTYLGQSEEVRAYRDEAGNVVSRRKFHSGSRAFKKDEILALGYKQLKLPGKFRFARGLTRQEKKPYQRKPKIPLDGLIRKCILRPQSEEKTMNIVEYAAIMIDNRQLRSN